MAGSATHQLYKLGVTLPSFTSAIPWKIWSNNACLIYLTGLFGSSAKVCVWQKICTVLCKVKVLKGRLKGKRNVGKAVSACVRTKVGPGDTSQWHFEFWQLGWTRIHILPSVRHCVKSKPIFFSLCFSSPSHSTVRKMREDGYRSIIHPLL